MEGSGSLQPQIRFERSGDLVRASDGRLAHRIRVAPSQRHGLLGYGDRQFPGELIVSAHPEGGLRLVELAPGESVDTVREKTACEVEV